MDAPRRAGARERIVLCGENLGTYLGAARQDSFRTGDLGYLGPGGELFVTGRKAVFLKNRGFRVSPERIESMLMAMNGIRDVRVLMRDSRLVAELVTRGDGTPPRHGVIDYLAERLPAYCVPDRISVVARIPRTPSGKIRRF